MFNLKRHRWMKSMTCVGAALCALLLATAFPMPGLAATAPTLGTASSFAVLGGSTVTNTGPTTVDGDLGVSPGNAVTGFPPGLVTGGTIHSADAVAEQAQSNVTTAYNELAGQSCDADLTDQDLGGQLLTAGTYCFSSSAQLTGTLTLDAQGDDGAVFIFQIGSTLTTASNSAVRMVNGGSPCNVYWKVGSSATLGTTTAFTGSILALASITLNTRATIQGRALARTAAVTMDNNVISISGCAPAQPTPTPVTPTPVTPTPVTPTPVTPTPVTPTPVSTATNTPTATPGGGTSGTPISTSTSTPTSTPSSTPAETPTSTPHGTPIGTPRSTATGTPHKTPTGIATATPSSTATERASYVSFPSTGSGGANDGNQEQSGAQTSFALGIALMLLLSGGVGVVVMARNRRP
jgi:hypothetical protein